jgi:hypothetical protein
MAVIKGVPNFVVYAAAAGAIYYFFIYESAEDKVKRLAKGGCM